jgi:hypothetical protein
MVCLFIEGYSTISFQSGSVAAASLGGNGASGQIGANSEPERNLLAKFFFKTRSEGNREEMARIKELSLKYYSDSIYSGRNQFLKLNFEKNKQKAFGAYLYYTSIAVRKHLIKKALEKYKNKNFTILGFLRLERREPYMRIKAFGIRFYWQEKIFPRLWTNIADRASLILFL